MAHPMVVRLRTISSADTEFTWRPRYSPSMTLLDDTQAASLWSATLRVPGWLGTAWEKATSAAR
jgi:hypothetical protein